MPVRVCVHVYTNTPNPPPKKKRVVADPLKYVIEWIYILSNIIPGKTSGINKYMLNITNCQ